MESTQKGIVYTIQIDLRGKLASMGEVENPQKSYYELINGMSWSYTTLKGLENRIKFLIGMEQDQIDRNVESSLVRFYTTNGGLIIHPIRFLALKEPSEFMFKSNSESVIKKILKKAVEITEGDEPVQGFIVEAEHFSHRERPEYRGCRLGIQITK